MRQTKRRYVRRTTGAGAGGGFDPGPTITPGQAAYVLEKLITTRAVLRSQVSAIIADMHREIAEVEARLNMLRGVAGQAPIQDLYAQPIKRRGPGRPRSLRPPEAERGSSTQPIKRRQSRRSATTKAGQREQGQYLSLLRRVSPNARPYYQSVLKAEGRAAAIARMRADAEAANQRLAATQPAI